MPVRCGILLIKKLLKKIFTMTENVRWIHMGFGWKEKIKGILKINV